MPFQAIAWAWKVELSDPVERCALIWMAGRCSPSDWHVYPFDPQALADFAGASAAEAAAAVASLVEKGLLTCSSDGLTVVVSLPACSMQEIAPGEFEALRNADPIPKGLYARVMRAYGGQCFACASKASPTVDHIIPRAEGGPNSFENLQVLCGPCNGRKRERLGWVPQ